MKVRDLIDKVGGMTKVPVLVIQGSWVMSEASVQAMQDASWDLPPVNVMGKTVTCFNFIDNKLIIQVK